MNTAEKRVSSVSFTNSESQNLNDYPSDINDEDNAQSSLDLNVEVDLSTVSQESGCWGRFLPIPFERAASKSWWDPMFDSEILEEQFKKSASSHNTRKFRYALYYMLLLSVTWFLYFLASGITTGSPHWPILCVILVFLTTVILTLIYLTYTNFFVERMYSISMFVAISLCVTSVFFVVPVHFDRMKNTVPFAGSVGHFSVCIEILLLVYTVIPLRLYIGIITSVLYSAAFEILTWVSCQESYDGLTLSIRLLVHVCIHLIGLHILIMTNVRMRNTFMTVGQSLLVRKQLESEKKLKENMIHSLMPPSVANWLLSEERKDGKEPRYSDPETGDIAKSLFRPFNMNRMKNVSILFADIVGFTKMSSTKTAEELVEILNTLFRRFDFLCTIHNCEKISTLGDCYYCVSGCPEPVPDHAKSCVEMGLSMINAIKQFDEENNEGINMRVGVHTGTILCGVVGTRRFKFDVWSNDVTLANTMESTSKPGMVHISETTREFLGDDYILDDAPQVSGFKTYFILGKKQERIASRNGSFKCDNKAKQNSLQLVVSPPTSPPSMSPQTRPRVLSCDTTALKPISNPNQLSPDVCRVKASSLPSILDSEAEQDLDGGNQKEQVKTPTSTASSGKYSLKLKSWKKFLKKLEAKEHDTQEQSLNDDASNCLYQQVPTIVEGQSSSQYDKKLDTSWTNVSQCFDEKTDMFFDDQRDAIDVKSYISQSRSDIGHYEFCPNEYAQFIRTGSYRSQYGRSNDYNYLSRTGSNRSKRGKSPNLDMMMIPSERARSITVSHFDRQKCSLEVPHRLSTILLDDQVSTGHSINSRKDSGIRSNSRKSSIQQIEPPYHPSSHQHRVSGYFTSSQSTINSPPYASTRLPPPSSVQHQRKQSDRQLIKCVQDNSKSKRSYFMKPPLSQISLFFLDKNIEKEYRANVHSINEQTKIIQTLANSRFNTYFDVFISVTIFVIVSICLFILSKFSLAWVIAFVLFSIVQVFSVLLCLESFSGFSDRFFAVFKIRDISSLRWYLWNIFGGILVSMPIIAILINIENLQNNYLCIYLFFVGVTHFCNFTQLNCWMRNILVTVFAFVFKLLSLIDFKYVDDFFNDKFYSANFINSTMSTSINSSSTNFVNFINFTNFSNSVTFTNSTTLTSESQNFKYFYFAEIFLDFFLLLALVWILNREFEKGYRSSFHAHYVANRDRINMLRLREQADLLIYNIVPEHVANQLKKDAKYSENFKDVGIIFASIVNFNEMYDESYLGGKEFLRVLNELIGDLDELLTRKEFNCIEKIKTIGSTFMAASGLDSHLRDIQQDPHEHLFALMDFALAMQDVVDKFNHNLLEFNLILRIGYNFGDVTAAVIGETKLYYDIWGDAVNIASRMDSTGVNNRIQVGEHCIAILEKMYAFEKRGSVYVKGKDNMNVYLLLGKRDKT